MALITPQTAGHVGGGAAPVVTYTAATASDTFLNTGKEILHVKNGSGGTVTVTLASQVNCNQGVNHPVTFTVAAAAEGVMGGLDTTRFNDTNNLVTITYSATTSVTIAVVKDS